MSSRRDAFVSMRSIQSGEAVPLRSAPSRYGKPHRPGQSSGIAEKDSAHAGMVESLYAWGKRAQTRGGAGAVPPSPLVGFAGFRNASGAPAMLPARDSAASDDTPEDIGMQSLYVLGGAQRPVFKDTQQEWFLFEKALV